MRRVVAVFVEGDRRSGRCSVRVFYYVLLLVVDVECRKLIVGVLGGVNEAVSIVQGS